MDTVFKTKAALSILLCLTILIQFCIPAFASDATSDATTEPCTENGTEAVSPLSGSFSEYDSESKEVETGEKPGVFVREYRLNDRSSDPSAELKIVNDERVTKTSSIELSFEGITDKAIVTKAILKLVKKSGTSGFIWYLSDDTRCYLGSNTEDGQTVEIDVTPSIRAAVEQGFTSLSLELAPYIEDISDDADNSGENRQTVSNGYVEFDAVRSSLTLNYTSADTYRDHSSIVSLGTGQAVDLYTGEMTFSVTDAYTNSPVFPVSICHNYSSLNGWRMNYEQTAELLPPDYPLQTDEFYKYVDGFGKEHFFMFIDGSLTDTGGLGMIFSFIQGGYQITDTDGNVLEFDSTTNKLVKILDKNGNYATITRNAYGRVSYVTDSFGRSFHFLYDLNTGKMTSVSDPSGRYTYFSYTGDNLTAITYPDGMSISFQYSDGKVSRIINPDGTKTSFTYSNSKLYRVNSIPSDSNTAEDYTRIAYSTTKTTEVVNRNGIAKVYVLDENGRAVGVYEKKYDEFFQPISELPLGTVLYSYTGTKRTFSSSIASAGANDIENWDFSGNSESPWVFPVNKSFYDGMFDGEYVINGSPGKTKYIQQTIDEEDVNVPYGNSMIFSAWAKATSALTGTFRIKAEVWYTNNSHTESEASFDRSYTDWQYVATPIKIDRDLSIDHIDVFLEYSNNSGTCHFDNARLVCAPAAESEYEQDLYQYITIFGTSRIVEERVTATDGIYTTVIEKDGNGDVLRQTVTDLDGNDFVSIFEYDSHRRLVKTQNYRKIITEYTYNSVGMVTETKTYYCYTFNPSYDPEPEEYFISRTEYDQSGEFAVGVGDSRSDSIETINTFNTTKGLLTCTTSPNGQDTSYSYDSDNDLLTSVTATMGNDVFSVLYGYDSARRPISVTHNGFVYGFTYDTSGREESFSIAGTTFYENSYELTENTIVTTEFASGESLTLEADRNSLPVKSTYTDSDDEDTVLSEGEYDDLGNPVSVIDYLTDIEYTYKYDTYGNVIREKRNNTTYKYSNYDSHCRLVSTSRGNETFVPVYETRSGGVIYPDGSITGMTLTGKYTEKNTADHYGRVVSDDLTLASCQTPLIRNEISYLSVEDEGDTRLTNFPKSFRTLVNGSETDSWTYTYDNNGNITSIQSSGNTIVRYVYDGMDRLIREDNSLLNATYTFSYDTAGNILEKKRYAFSLATLGTPVETKAYTYAATGWKDRLISFSGSSISYDVLGNPTSYRGHSLSWGMVRQLKSYDQNTFEYNASGIRVRKNGTSYELDGETIVRESRTGTVIDYRYGVSGLVGFTLNGTDYYYTKDLFGDIVGIYGADGTKYAAYVYDAWGNHTITLDTNGIGTINPFRYRGYYFDTETGLYYLQTRYYDPLTGRFLNADSRFDSDTKMTKYNLYSFCLDNPVANNDRNGTDAILLLDEMNEYFFGHLGVIFQCDGKWWHFYWGPAETTLDVANPFGSVEEYQCYLVEFDGDFSKVYDGTYEAYYYIEGDFSKSYDFAKYVAENSDYNLYFNNCAQVTLEVLAASDTTYKYVFANSRVINITPRRAFMSVVLACTQVDMRNKAVQTVENAVTSFFNSVRCFFASLFY